MQRGTDGIVRMIGWRVGDPPRTSEHILRMDPTLDLERRRLLISAALTAQTRRRLGGSLAANLSVGELQAHPRVQRPRSGRNSYWCGLYHAHCRPPSPGVGGACWSEHSRRLAVAGRLSLRPHATRPAWLMVPRPFCEILQATRGTVLSARRRGGVRVALRATRGKRAGSPTTLREGCT